MGQRRKGGTHPGTADVGPELDEPERGPDMPLHHLGLDLREAHLGEIGGRGIKLLVGELLPPPFLPYLVLSVIDHIVKLIRYAHPPLPLGEPQQERDDKDEEEEEGKTHAGEGGGKTPPSPLLPHGSLFAFFCV